MIRPLRRSGSKVFVVCCVFFVDVCFCCLCVFCFVMLCCVCFVLFVVSFVFLLFLFFDGGGEVRTVRWGGALTPRRGALPDRGHPSAK